MVCMCLHGTMAMAYGSKRRMCWNNLQSGGRIHSLFSLELGRGHWMRKNLMLSGSECGIRALERQLSMRNSSDTFSATT